MRSAELVELTEENSKLNTGYTLKQLVALTGFDGSSQQYDHSFLTEKTAIIYYFEGVRKIVVILTIESPIVSLNRSIEFNNRVILNHSIKVKTQRIGIGTEIFYNQYYNAFRKNFRQIRCYAEAPSEIYPDKVGHLVWAKLGFIVENNERHEMNTRLKKDLDICLDQNHSLLTTIREEEKLEPEKRKWHNRPLSYKAVFEIIPETCFSVRHLIKYYDDKSHSKDVSFSNTLKDDSEYLTPPYLIPEISFRVFDQ